jgi:hypothetical protein
MNDIIIEDIKNMIKSLNNNYNSKYSLELLYDRYIPNISIENNSEKTIKKRINLKKKNKNKVPELKYRCIARCWGGENSVSYNPITKKWKFGYQCSRHKSIDRFCLTHYKQFKSSLGLTHGIFTEEPPHPHYLKYKHKIESKFVVKS